MSDKKNLKIEWCDTEWWDEVPLDIFNDLNKQEPNNHKTYKLKRTCCEPKEIEAEFRVQTIELNGFFNTFLIYDGKYNKNKYNKIYIGILLIVTDTLKIESEKNIKLIQFIQDGCTSITNKYKIL